ncbi:MAG TPA: PAS domain S-box protein [Methanosarcinales archaeon]|nr:PAS domain S-box protein [Methanosarcinales archaeon]
MKKEKENNIEGYYKGLEKKIIGIFLVFLVIPLAIFSIISLNNMKEISYNIVDDSKMMGASVVNDSIEICNIAINESKNALENQTELYLQQLAISEAIQFNNFLVNIEENAETIADYARDLFSSDSEGTCFSDRVMVSVPITKESLDELFISTDRMDTSTLNLIKFYLDNPYYETKSFLIKKALKDPVQKVVNKAYCMDKMLKPIVDNDPHISWAYMGFNNGVTVLYPYDENPASYDPRKRGWYIKAVEENKTIITGMYVDAGGAGLMITSATPVYARNKNLIGVIGVDVTLETLKQHILSINIENGYAFVIDKNGKIIFRPDLEVDDTRWDESFETDNLLETNNTELRQIVENMISGNTGYGKLDFEGFEKYIAYAPINTTSWSLGIVVPDREIIKSAIVTKQKIENATNQISNNIDQTTKKMSTDIKEKTNIMKNLFLWMILFSIGIISIAAIYLGRNVRYYGDKITESEKKYRYLFENANYAIYTLNKLGIMESFNPEAERMTGYKAEEVIGKTFKIFFSDKEIGEKKVENLFKSVVKEGKSIQDYELIVKHKQGYEFPIEININPLYNKEGNIVGLQGIAIDISEKKKLEQQLKEYTEKLEQKVKERTKEIKDLKRLYEIITQGIPSAVILHDKEIRIIFVNNQFTKITELTKDEVLGKTPYEFLPESAIKEIGLREKLYRVQDHSEIIGPEEIFYKTKSGKEIILEHRIYPLLDDNGSTQYILTVLDDITEKKRLEEQLIQSEKMASIGELASGIAHNLRSPLAAIKGIPELILEDLESGYIKVLDEKGEDYEPIKEQLHIVINGTKKCLGIINNVMSFSRPKELREMVSIEKIISDALELIENLLIKNKIEIIKNIEDHKIYGNKNQLMQVFINLFTNAKDAMSKGGKLFITAKKINEEIEIKVKDTGIGIKEEYINRIFEPFFSTKGTAEGAGIGLSISQKIILEHDGSITVESEVGKGATFTIKLPIGSR